MSPRGPIFVVEDDARIAAVVSDYLRHAGYRVALFPDARMVIDRARAEAPAAVVLDMMLPAGSGIQLCKSLRGFSDVPIVMLTARVGDEDVVEALAAGADEYVTKPFSPRQLVARVEALLRRAEGGLARTDSGFSVDEPAMRIAWNGAAIELSPFEFRILSAMIAQPGRIFSRGLLLDRLGDIALDSGERAIDSHIKNIRQKLHAIAPDAPRIGTVYGVGYRLGSGPISRAIEV